MTEYMKLSATKQMKYISNITDAAKDRHFDGYDMLVGDLEKL